MPLERNPPITVEEALAIAEAVLEDQPLNKVQEIIFRECWQGRKSYSEIAKNYEYHPDYIKDAGAKLWKLLSKALEEKVKKDNLRVVFKRYLRRTKLNLQRNLVIEVNLSGADLSGSNLSVAKLVANLIEESDVSQADTQGKVSGDRPNSNKQREERVYPWNDWQFTSEAQLKIAETLDRLEVVFFPNARGRLTTRQGRQNQEFSFLIFHRGKWGILEIERDIPAGDADNNERINPTFPGVDICLVRHYQHRECCEQPEQAIADFLERLIRS
jgi:hypothetical protein